MVTKIVTDIIIYRDTHNIQFVKTFLWLCLPPAAFPAPVACCSPSSRPASTSSSDASDQAPSGAQWERPCSVIEPLSLGGFMMI